ncbi:MAG: hypothetical protein GQ470_02770 [Gammaproteobacteria bacterium]|nr:hypothetical protein [Gammaproteobacteria bacterium]
MSTRLTYNGYTCEVTLDNKGESIFGRILFIQDIIVFESDTIVGLIKEFKAAIDDYLATCNKSGDKTDRLG